MDLEDTKTELSMFLVIQRSHLNIHNVGEMAITVDDAIFWSGMTAEGDSLVAYGGKANARKLACPIEYMAFSPENWFATPESSRIRPPENTEDGRPTGLRRGEGEGEKRERIRRGAEGGGGNIFNPFRTVNSRPLRLQLSVFCV
ncbi:hypothetical protein KIN20_019810 [Parelaphostrongylus tenuis]|uniref:Uncharacterized protein n=1 Tax=Parelaphostrongylus tenuis TaxID=148309 RepID=A0AAD5MQ42_PARTN|nr:hypothetical protein KIN20_019810 [Parelaphostrongylus tenuis]